MAKKTGKLTKVEKFYIENYFDIEASKIAKDLNRSETSVAKHIDSLDKKSHTTEAKSNPSDVSNLMGHKEGRGVTIMTPAASERGDNTRSSRTGKAERHQTAIHTIKK